MNVQLKGSARSLPRHATLLGEVDANERFSVTVVLRRRQDGPPLPDLDYFTQEPPRRRRRLSREEFTEKFGAHPDELHAVETFARRNGLAVQNSHAGRRHVVLEGTAEQFSHAFGVGLKQYALPPAQRRSGPPGRQRSYRGREGYIHVPEELAESIVGVFGLDNRPIGIRASNPGDPPIIGALTVQQVTQLYNFPAPGAAIGGQTIGIISPIGIGGEGGLGGFFQGDIDQTFESVGLTPPQVIPVSVDGVINGVRTLPASAAASTGQSMLTFASTEGLLNNAVGQYTIGNITYLIYATAVTPTTVTFETRDPNTYQWGITGLFSDVPAGTTIYFNLDGETNQDICISSLAAEGANVAVYFTNNTQSGWVDMIGRVLHPEAGDFPAGVNPPSVLTASWSIAAGDDPDGLSWSDSNFGTGVSTAVLDAMTAAFQDAAILQDGPTICIATGDIGSNSYVGSLGSPAQGDGYAHVMYPASDPWVLAVGGTTIGQYQPGGGAPAWVEYAWNDPFQDPSYPWGTGGGGVSDYFPLPSYQSEAGVPGSINPGISQPQPSTIVPTAPFNAGGRGVPDVAANASLNSGYSGFYFGGVMNGGGLANGTSAAAPLWAGLIAVLNSNAGFNIGFANPTFYTMGTGAFNATNPLWRDPAYPQLAGCPADNGNNGIPGYPTGPGWDACTGLGSPNGMGILGELQALDGVYVLGGYQSPDIVLTDLGTNQPVPIGGEPNGRWDTLLVPATDYGLSATVNNDGPYDANSVMVTFWAIPGGLGTSGTMIGTPVAVDIPARSSLSVQANAPFKSAAAGEHLCAVVSIYNPPTGCTVEAQTALEIPDPGYSMTHRCAAWRNTDSMFALAGGPIRFPLGLGHLPFHIEDPVVLTLNTKHVPARLLNTPAIVKIANTLKALGAKSNQPLYLLPGIVQGLEPVTLRQTVRGLHGVEVKPGREGEWLVHPQGGREATTLEITGEVPAAAAKGDVLLVNVTARYPSTRRRAARTVGFLQFVYVTNKTGRN